MAGTIRLILASASSALRLRQVSIQLYTSLLPRLLICSVDVAREASEDCSDGNGVLEASKIASTGDGKREGCLIVPRRLMVCDRGSTDLALSRCDGHAMLARAYLR